MIVDGQVQGGIAQGLGAVLMEGMAYSEDGQPLTTTLLDYVIPTSADVPHIELDHFETPSTTTEGGMKGAGEGGVIGAVPAISLAIADALAEYRPTITRLPLTPTAILELMHAGAARR
jgi:carbon-monoxide dehydrogenase large subunit